HAPCLSPLPCLSSSLHRRALHSFPTRRSSDLGRVRESPPLPASTPTAWPSERRSPAYWVTPICCARSDWPASRASSRRNRDYPRSEEHTSELQSRSDLVCRLLLEKKKQTTTQQ